MSQIIMKIHLTFIFKLFVIENQIINLILHFFLLEFISTNEKCGTMFFNMDKIYLVHICFENLTQFGIPKF
jgi:hypothetical protein